MHPAAADCNPPAIEPTAGEYVSDDEWSLIASDSCEQIDECGLGFPGCEETFLDAVSASIVDAPYPYEGNQGEYDDHADVHGLQRVLGRHRDLRITVVG